MNLYCWIATAICMAGTALNVKRIDLCFYFWAVGEVMWMVYDARQRLFSRFCLDLLGLGFAVCGAVVNY